MQNITAEKIFFVGSKHTDRVDKTKDLWKAFKALSLTKKSGGFIISALDLEYDTKSTLKTFINF